MICQSLAVLYEDFDFFREDFSNLLLAKAKLRACYAAASAQLILFAAEKNRCTIASHIAYSIVQYIRRHCLCCKGPLSDQDLNWGNPTCAYKQQICIPYANGSREPVRLTTKKKTKFTKSNIHRTILHVYIKFGYCKKVTQFKKLSHFFSKLLSNVKRKWEIFSNFCGLLRISELYTCEGENAAQHLWCPNFSS